MHLADRFFHLWAPIGRESDRMRYIIATPETLFYVDGSGVAAEEAVELLTQFVRPAQ